VKSTIAAFIFVSCYRRLLGFKKIPQLQQGVSSVIGAAGTQPVRWAHGRKLPFGYRGPKLNAE
jgi:hypothetical protein